MRSTLNYDDVIRTDGPRGASRFHIRGSFPSAERRLAGRDAVFDMHGNPRARPAAYACKAEPLRAYSRGPDALRQRAHVQRSGLPLRLERKGPFCAFASGVGGATPVAWSPFPRSRNPDGPAPLFSGPRSGRGEGPPAGRVSQTLPGLSRTSSTPELTPPRAYSNRDSRNP
jgi:hypothetical protein